MTTNYCDVCGKKINEDDRATAYVHREHDNESDMETYDFHKECLRQFASFFKRGE